MNARLLSSFVILVMNNASVIHVINFIVKFVWYPTIVYVNDGGLATLSD